MRNRVTDLLTNRHRHRLKRRHTDTQAQLQIGGGSERARERDVLFIFFLYPLFRLLVFQSRAIEVWRGVVRSMPDRARSMYKVYLRSMRIHVWDMWRVPIQGVYVVYVLTWRIGWRIGIRYIFNFYQ